MKLALLQKNLTVGDLHGNGRALEAGLRAAQDGGADLAVSSELSLVGYPPRDLLERPDFIAAIVRATEALALRTGAVPLVFGTVGVRNGRLENQAIVAQNGRVVARASKQLLPNYDVFDEQRYFHAGNALAAFELQGQRIAVSICEDAWGRSATARYRYDRNPLDALLQHRADLLLNLSASPFTTSKRNERERIFQDVARHYELPIAMVNQVGANDELIFDGASALFARDGSVLARAKPFEEDVLFAELTRGGSVTPVLPTDEEAAYRALVLGVRDYARKCGFSSAVLGLSGGIDSALVATIAADALGPDHVLGVALPSRYSSEGSLVDARALATSLGIAFRVLPIDTMFQGYLDALGPALDDLATARADDTTWENVQARIRGATVMAISNRTYALPLTTGNKSELAVGYCTLYGDMVGGLAVINDVPKTMVYRIARWLNRDGERIPWSSVEKPPSAELRPDQLDQDTLPPYDVLDAILERYVERQEAPEAIIAAGFARDTVLWVERRIVGSEFKRRQAAPGLIITDKAFGSGRRLPIARAMAWE